MRNARELKTPLCDSLSHTGTHTVTAELINCTSDYSVHIYGIMP